MSVTVPVVPFAPIEVRRERLLAVAGLLGVHPSGAVMAALLHVPSAVLRTDLAGRPGIGAPSDHLALLALFATLARDRLADPDPDVYAIRLAAWRTWVATPSLVGATGPERPLDRLSDPGAVADAIRDLVAGTGLQAGRDDVRVVTLGRSGEGPAKAR